MPIRRLHGLALEVPESKGRFGDHYRFFCELGTPSAASRLTRGCFAAIGLLCYSRPHVSLRRWPKSRKQRAAQKWLTGLLQAGQPHVLSFDTDAAVLLGRMNETPALRNFLVHEPATKKTKTGADLAIASIAIAHKAVVTTGNCSDFLLIHRDFPLPGLYDPFQDKWHVKPS